MSPELIEDIYIISQPSHSSTGAWSRVSHKCLSGNTLHLLEHKLTTNQGMILASHNEHVSGRGFNSHSVQSFVRSPSVDYIFDRDR